MTHFDDDYKPVWRCADMMPLDQWARPLMKLSKEEIIKLYFEAVIDANGILDELQQWRGQRKVRT
jgi:hypothetical protein